MLCVCAYLLLVRMNQSSAAMSQQQELPERIMNLQSTGASRTYTDMAHQADLLAVHDLSLPPWYPD